MIGRMLNRKTEEIPAGFRSMKVEVTKRDEKVLSLSLFPFNSSSLYSSLFHPPCFFCFLSSFLFFYSTFSHSFPFLRCRFFVFLSPVSLDARGSAN